MADSSSAVRTAPGLSSAPSPRGTHSHAAPARRPRLSATGVVIVVIAVALASRAVIPDDAGFPLSGLAQDFLTLGTSVIVESFPFVVLGTLLAAVVQIWLPAGLMERVLPSHALPRRVALSLLGVLLPVCECGNVPLARGLLQRGFSVGEAMTFLLAAPIINPVTIITTYQAFGWDHGILAGRLIGGFVIANVIGTVFARHPDPESLLTARFAASCHTHHDEHGDRIRRTVDLFSAEMRTMIPALLLGSAIAAGIQVGVSRNVLVELGASPAWSVLALMLLALIVSVCSNVDAFFILGVASLFQPGAVVAFLTFGAMIDVKMLALMRTTFRAGALVRLTILVALLVATLGFGVNLLV